MMMKREKKKGGGEGKIEKKTCEDRNLRNMRDDDYNEAGGSGGKTRGEEFKSCR